MPDASVIENSAVAPTLNQHFAQAENFKTVRITDFRGDANLNREIEYFLYIFNIAPRKFAVCRPPSFPLMNFSACPAGQPWALVGRVPNIVNEKWIDADSGEIRTRGMMGERFATDLLNPANVGIDIWAEITDDQLKWVDGGTDDLTRRGMFWSRNEVPSAQELANAKDRMQRHYKVMLQQADELAVDPKTRREIGMEHHLAAEYFRAKSSWHIVAEIPVTCPNCGDSIREGIAYHMGPLGPCIIDWKRAVAAGVRKKEDVPEEARWWDEKDFAARGTRVHKLD
jgi:hypothetical protein